MTPNDFTSICNANITSSSECTPQTCCLAQGQIQYLPNLPGNAFFAAIFGLLLVTHLFFGLRFKTWSFGTWMVLGLLTELIGYIGRIMLHNNIFSFNAFLIYLIPLTIAPAFITASIYLCLARIVHILDPNLEASRLKPMTYTKIFVTFDLISLILQGAGGGIAATADDKKGSDLGVDVMMAGLAFQVIALVVFSTLCSDFAWRLYKKSGSPSRGKMIKLPALEQGETQKSRAWMLGSGDTMFSASYDVVKRSRMFKAFIFALATAVILIIVRSSYRVAELKDGFNGHLANDEVTFMILEGPMIILACLALTICHPGFALKGMWSMKEFERQSADIQLQSGKVGLSPSRNSSQEGLSAGNENAA